MFASFVGNTTLQRALRVMIERGSIGNSFLFAGPDGVGKALLAQLFCEHLIGQEPHPDIHHYRPEGKLGMHSIEAMRRLSQEAHLPPYQAPRKAFIIHAAERMLPTSANALLKTFEEPPADSLIILISSAPELLLGTIISRCRRFDFHPLQNEEVAALLVSKKSLAIEPARQIAALSGGSVGYAFNLAERGENPMRRQLLEILAADKFPSYGALISTAKTLADTVLACSKEGEERLRSEILTSLVDKPMAAQREAIEKEIEGHVALCQIEEAGQIFDIILTWFRDRHLLAVQGDEKYLLNPDWAQELRRVPIDNFSLEFVLEAVQDAKTSLARSIALNIVLENLFLRLDLI